MLTATCCVSRAQTQSSMPASTRPHRCLGMQAVPRQPQQQPGCCMSCAAWWPALACSAHLWPACTCLPVLPCLQKWENRVRCLKDLKDIGFMVSAAGAAADQIVPLLMEAQQTQRQQTQTHRRPHQTCRLLASTRVTRHTTTCHPPPCCTTLPILLPAGRHGCDGGPAGADAARPGWGPSLLQRPGSRYDWHGSIHY